MLDIQHISKTFNPGTVNEKKAITDLSLHLNKGEFVTVIGSNGAGKSTLFNAIAGSFYVDDGAITVGGHDMTFLPEYKRAKRIGRLFQDPLKGTAPNMTIEENLALVALIGNKLSQACGVGKEVFGVLEPFNIRMICYGASSHNLCFLVPGADAEKVVQKLHHNLFE